MATKQRNQQTFTADVTGYGTLYFHAWTTDTRCGFCHSVWCDDLERLSSKSATTKVSYYNRTWERFDYETVLRRAIEKFPKAMQQELNDQLIERKAKAEHERCEAMVGRFKQLHAGLTDRQKEVLAQTPPMQSEEDMHRMMGIMGVMNIFNSLG